MKRGNRIASIIGATLILLSASAISFAQSEWQSITEWRAYAGTEVPTEWAISDGTVAHTPGGGDLISVESFADVVITFDWMIAPGGNSGVFYRVDENDGASFQSGPEYQILDNAGHPDGKSPVTSAASAYGLYAPSRDATHPVGEWNSAKIVLRGNHVEHWLNGEKVLSFNISSADWRARVAGSKFADWPAFATRPAGHIVLQDHGSAVSYRNFMVRRLPD